MPANFTRRLDLFRDAGLARPDEQLVHLAAEVGGLGLPALLAGSGAELEPLREVLARRVERLPPEQARLAVLVPEWLLERNGDLASALWLAQAESGERFDAPGFLLAVFKAFLDTGREKEAVPYARFMLDLKFDWSRVYRDPSIAHAFMQERDPNPFVWRLLEELEPMAPLRVVELGCGVGNDALGLLRSPLVDAYTGIDLVEPALDVFRRRASQLPASAARPELVRGDIVQLLEAAELDAVRPNVVYSYSSLHYFSSSELQQIFSLVKNLLLGAGPRPGVFAFAIKGEGSVWEGQGLPLYRPDVWVNRDGQSRWFPSRKALARHVDRAGFELRLHEMHDHWGYSEPGRRDVFHYIVCSPRAEYLGAAI